MREAVLQLKVGAFGQAIAVVPALKQTGDRLRDGMEHRGRNLIAALRKAIVPLDRGNRPAQSTGFLASPTRTLSEGGARGNQMRCQNTLAAPVRDALVPLPTRP